MKFACGRISTDSPVGGIPVTGGYRRSKMIETTTMNGGLMTLNHTLAAVLTLLATPAASGPYDGTYKQAANAECDLVGVDGGSVKISKDIFYGVELECRMTNPVDVLEMDALLYTMQCSGQDQLFSERAMLMNKAEGDGIIMIWNGYAFVYDRCSESENTIAPHAADTATVAPEASPAAVD